MKLFEKAKKLVHDFKGQSYTYGPGVLAGMGKTASEISKRAVLFRGSFPGSDDYVNIIIDSLREWGVEITGEFRGSRPNSPREDLMRITGDIMGSSPEMVISFGGGSTIDSVKAAIILSSLGGSIDDYLGMGLVSEALGLKKKKLIPHIASQTLASSAAHLSKYSNITDMAKAQKKLIVDEAIIPTYAVFDYSITYNAPPDVSADGAFDGISHLIEVLYSAEGKPGFDLAYSIAETGIELIVKYLPRVMDKPDYHRARHALCLGTDLGGYSIMVGGTNGGHLTSFSLVDILSHGRACAMMNPYYSVFFAPAIGNSLHLICRILSKYGYAGKDFKKLTGRKLGIYTASAMMAFARSIGFPTRLDEIEGFSSEHIRKALEAAKEPALSSKLQNMPVPLTASMIDRYMGKVLESAANGDLKIIENV